MTLHERLNLIRRGIELGLIQPQDLYAVLREACEGFVRQERERRALFGQLMGRDDSTTPQPIVIPKRFLARDGT